VRLLPPCRLGAEWFSARLRGPPGPQATINGQPTDVRTALTRAAELLRRARRPLVYGFDGATVEDTRAALTLGDRLGALVATDVAAGAWGGAAAVPLRGASTATLGEIRDRSRLVVIWREDPESSHPRLLERLGFDGGPLSRPSAERTLVVIDDGDTATARRADLRLCWAPERDLDALITLHALQRGLTLRASDLRAQLRGLLERMTSVPHVAFVHGPSLTGGSGGERRALALHELVRELCHQRHVVTLALPRAAGTVGARDVLAWQTGYSGNVDFANAHPELVVTARTLESEGVDVALRVEAAQARLPDGVAEIVLGSLLPSVAVEVGIRTAAAGVEATGTAHRLDGVPLALQAPLRSEAPATAALLSRLLAEIEP
jgi:formylmethanofuran dehydrogenase subunit B